MIVISWFLCNCSVTYTYLRPGGLGAYLEWVNENKLQPDQRESRALIGMGILATCAFDLPRSATEIERSKNMISDYNKYTKLWFLLPSR